MRYLGIDPGLGGGLALLREDGSIDDVTKMPVTERDVLDWLTLRAADARGMLEKVHAMPRQGVSSVFTFGKGYGGLRMALLAAEIPFDEVTPQKWQRALQCRTGGDKSITKRRAQELWPGHRITNYIADALLIAEFGRRLHRS